MMFSIRADDGMPKLLTGEGNPLLYVIKTQPLHSDYFIMTVRDLLLLISLSILLVFFHLLYHGVAHDGVLDVMLDITFDCTLEGASGR